MRHRGWIVIAGLLALLVAGEAQGQARARIQKTAASPVSCTGAGAPDAACTGAGDVVVRWEIRDANNQGTVLTNGYELFQNASSGKNDHRTIRAILAMRLNEYLDQQSIVEPADATTAVSAQGANKLMAGPTSGSAMEPAFRNAVLADISALVLSTPRSETSFARRWFYLVDSGAGLNGFGADVQTVTGTGSDIAPVDSAPYARNVASASTTGSDFGIVGTQAWRHDRTAGERRNVYFKAVGTTQESASIRHWWGLTDQTLATMAGSDNPAGNHAALRFSSAAGANWSCVTKNGSTQNVVDSGTAFAGGTYYALEVIFDDSAPSVTFKINGASVCGSPVTASLPADGTNLRWCAPCGETTAAAAKNARLERLWVESLF